MEVIEVEIYSFDELDDKAKEQARAWLRDRFDYPWWQSAHESIRAFVEHFGASVTDWRLGSGSGRDYIKTDITPANFRGRKLKDYDRAYMPTGYCLDNDLWTTFYDEWKRTSDPVYAFEQAIEATICAIQNDIDYQYSDECVDENLKINDYKFTKDGRIWG